MEACRGSQPSQQARSFAHMPLLKFLTTMKRKRGSIRIVNFNPLAPKRTQIVTRIFYKLLDSLKPPNKKIKIKLKVKKKLI